MADGVQSTSKYLYGYFRTFVRLTVEFAEGSPRKLGK